MTPSTDAAGTGFDSTVAAPAVLVIDADPVRRHLSVLMLRRLGCPLSQTAESLEHAAALPESGAYDVVLLDLAADEPHALDALCTWFQTQAAPAPHIIAVTGADSADLRDSCLATQGVVQLRRPLTRDALAAALAAAAVSPCRADADFNPLTWSEWLRVFGERGLTEVVAVMTADLGEQQRRHAAAAQAGDLYALRQIAHALRGASLQFGAEALADLCNRAESAALAGDGPQALSLGKQMMTRHTALVARMQRQSGLLQRA